MESHLSHNPVSILVFLRAPIVGRVKTRLAQSIGDDRATQVYRKLVEHQLSQIPADYSVDIYYTGVEERTMMQAWLGDSYAYFKQSGGDLGERLKGGFSSAFSRGAKSVIAIGGDCPYLDAAILRDACDALSKAYLALGPALDGGYYLIAMRQPILSVFDNITWGTDQVFAQTCLRLQSLGQPFTSLKALEDVDDLESYQRVQESIPELDL